MTFHQYALHAKASRVALVKAIKVLDIVAKTDLGPLEGKTVKIDWFCKGEPTTTTGEFRLYIPKDEIVEKKLHGGNINLLDHKANLCYTIQFEDVINIEEV